MSSGGGGNDRIFANLGQDRSFGGDGNDDLWALARGDVTMLGDPLGDALAGGDGNDRFHVRDGEVDAVDCGAGNDRVIADQFDLILGATPANFNGSCERVTRRSVQPGADAQENRLQSPAEDRKES